jgi:hypothetical protein
MFGPFSVGMTTQWLMNKPVPGSCPDGEPDQPINISIFGEMSLTEMASRAYFDSC